jgi:raffinose/stachyose/melibiose transport system permease protein
MLPAFSVYTLFLIVPLAGTLVLSLTSWDGISWSSLQFVGFANFREIFHDSTFTLALKNNGIFLAGAIIVKTTLALAFAVALEQRLRFSKLFRSIYLMPAVMSLVTIGIVFNLVLSPTFGFMNPLLHQVGLGQYAGEWLGDPHRAFPLIIAIDAWHDFGVYMFLFLIRLMNIPEEFYEAALVDGARRLRALWHVTLPLLRSTIILVVMLASIESLKLFDLVYVLTQGGPGDSTEVLSHYAYLQNFQGNRVGYGSAILVVLLGITLCLSIAFVSLQRVRSEK